MGFYWVPFGSMCFRGFPCIAAMVGCTGDIWVLCVSMGFYAEPLRLLICNRLGRVLSI